MVTSDINPVKLIDRFIREKDLSPSAKKIYGFLLHRFFKWMVFEGRKAHKVDPETIVSYKNSMKKNELAAPYINLNINVLRSFYRWQVQQKIRRTNIAQFIRVEPVKKRHRRGVLSEAEIKQLLDSISRENIQGARDHAMILLAYSNGLRSVELSRLQLKHIDLEKKSIQIRGKGHYDLVIADLADATVTAIASLIGKRTDEGEALEPNSHLFTGYSHNPEKNNGCLQPATISKIIGKRMLEAGVKNHRVTSHSLRHSAAVHLIQKGASMHLVSLFLRHTSVAITQIYTHYSEEKLLSDAKPSKMLTESLNIQL